MPCVSVENRSHALRLKPAWPLVPIEVATAESGLSIPGMVHKLLSRDEWKGRPEAAQTIEKEKSGLLLEGTWDESAIRRKGEIISEAQKKGETVHLASLMIIVSIKGYEENPPQWTVKARIVLSCFRAFTHLWIELSHCFVFNSVLSHNPTWCKCSLGSC